MSYIRKVRKIVVRYRDMDTLIADHHQKKVREAAGRKKGWADVAGKRVVVIGVDPSLVGTALVVVVSGGGIEYSHGWTDVQSLQKRHPEQLSYFKIPDHAGMADRLARIALMTEWVTGMIDEWSSVSEYEVYVAIEGLAVSQRSNRASDLAELGGGIKQWLMRNTVPFRIYDPSTLKRAWTGHGDADKPMMMMACFRRFGVDYTQLEKAGDNFADATLLAQLLYHEVEIRAGRKDVKDLDGLLKTILRRATKKEPVSLLEQELISIRGVRAKDPIVGSP